MALVQCLDLQLIFLAIIVISLIISMEQIAECIYFKKDKSMKIKIVFVCLPRFFDGDRLPAFADNMKFFIMYKKHWW